MSIYNCETFVEEAIKIAKSIGVKYKLLKTLDMSNLKTQILYENTKKELVNLWDQEHELYKKNIANVQEAVNIIRTLMKMNNIKHKVSIEESIHKNDGTFPAEQRVFYILDKIITYDTERNYEKTKTSAPQFVITNLSSQEMKKQINANLIYEKSILKNYYSVFLAFLEKYLLENEYLRTQIIHIKYLLPYLFQDLEIDFYKNNFKTDLHLYLNHIMTGDLNHLPIFIQKIKIMSLLMRKFAEERENLLKTTDKDFDDDSLNVIISKYFMKSAAIFFEEDFILEDKKVFQECLLDDYQIYINSCKSTEVINEIYNSTKKDKQQHKYLSLRPINLDNLNN